MLFSVFHASLIKPIGWRPTFKRPVRVVQHVVVALGRHLVHGCHVPHLLDYSATHFDTHSSTLPHHCIQKTRCELGFNCAGANLPVRSGSRTGAKPCGRAREELSAPDIGTNGSTLCETCTDRLCQSDL
uniref:Uncharacterized protein n=1 Tax=Cacopsylla melanoneura TaxID=428564 RepID=A0A8D9EGY5_9HEMI